MISRQELAEFLMMAESAGVPYRFHSVDEMKFETTQGIWMLCNLNSELDVKSQMELFQYKIDKKTLTADVRLRFKKFLDSLSYQENILFHEHIR